MYYSYVDPETYLVSVVIAIVVAIVVAIIFGCITRRINEGKGYTGGFAWGFWLGPIGIIVVACRSSNHSYSSRNSNYSFNSNNNVNRSPSLVEKPAAPVKAATWKCGKCDKENILTANFCARCGERRHYKWKCASCGKENEPDVRFCPACGNALTDEQEAIPQQPNSENNMLEYLRTLNSATEIADAFAENYSSSDDEDIRAMKKMLAKANELERLYGNAKNYAIACVDGFYKHGMKTFAVNRRDATIECPACNSRQRSDRDYCYQCGALFRD